MENEESGCLELLHQIVNIDPHTFDGMGNAICHFCREEIEYVEHHHKCAYIAAKKFLEGRYTPK